MKIVVLAGGLSPERNVSLSTGAKVCQALRERGHAAALVDMYFGLEGYEGVLEGCFDAPIPESWRVVSRKAPDLEQIKKSRKWKGKGAFGPGVLELCSAADLVFLALHGQCGEDGRVQAAFDLLGIPYTGSGYLGSAIAMDKDLTKQLMAGRGVATPAWKTVTYTAEEVDSITSRTPVPCVVKPVDSGSSIGVSIALDKKALRAALIEGLHYGGRCVLEQYVSGREIQVGVLAGRALPTIEIRPKEGFYDYENKYQPDAAEEICPAPITAEQERMVQEAALKVFHGLKLSAYARADFILDQKGTFWFLEINTLPGMTPTSLLPQEAAAAGVCYSDLCQMILDVSLEARVNGK